MGFGAFAALAGAGLASSGFNAWSNYSTSKKLMNKQYELNMRQWNAQNEYNLPVNQMQRLTDAGLNPHLVYGNGGASSTASTPSSVSQGSFSGMKADVLGDLLNYQNLKNMETSRIATEVDTANKAMVADGQRNLLDAQTQTVNERNFQLSLENGVYRSFMENRPMTSAEKLYVAVNMGKFVADKSVQLLGMGRNSMLGAVFGQ